MADIQAVKELLAAMAAGALLGAISGLLKAYCNVNEVISGIMLNWITLYLVNMLLTLVKEGRAPRTMPRQPSRAIAARRGMWPRAIAVERYSSAQPSRQMTASGLPWRG